MPSLHEKLIYIEKKSSGKSEASINLSRWMRSRPHKHIENLLHRKMSKPQNVQNAHFRFKLYNKNKSMNTKTYFYLYQISTKITHIKYENNTSITQSLGTYISMTYLQENFGVFLGKLFLWYL